MTFKDSAAARGDEGATDVAPAVIVVGGASERAAAILAKINERSADGKLVRSATVAAVDVDARTVELAFSSEAEVSRWFGIEVLSHEAGACDLSRLNDGGAVLWNHAWADQRGVVERAWIDADGKGRALVRLSQNPAGEELLRDIADGIKRHVSVGYMVKAIKLTEEREDVDVYTVTRWLPYEISFVSVPADTDVGVGRDASKVAITAIASGEEHADVPADSQETRNATKEQDNHMPDPITNPIDADAARRQGQSAERERVRELTDLANEYGANIDGTETMLRDALANGDDANKFQRALMVKLHERANKPLQEQLAGGDIGLSDKEQRSYSVLNVVRALVDPTDTRAQKAAAFEFEASAAARKQSGKDTEHFMIPTDVLRRSVFPEFNQRAPHSTGKAGGVATGGYSIATDLHAQSFIEILRNKSSILSMARVLGGLQGNVDIPKQISAANSFWLGAEDDELDETGIELAQISLSPKTIGAFAEITRKLLVQSSLDFEAMVRADLAIAAALGIDRAGYYGKGAGGEPLGLANVTGIHGVPFAGLRPTYAELVSMETEIAADNADVDGMNMVANARFRGHCKTTRKFPDAVDGGVIWEAGNTVNGYPARITNQINDGDVFFGNFNDVIVGMWGGLELAVDPYTHSRRGRIRLTTFQDVDFAHRRGESLALGRKVAAG